MSSKQGEKNKNRKTMKSRLRKIGGFQLSLPIPRIETGGSPKGGTRQVIDHHTQRITQGTDIVKSVEDKRDRGRIPDTFT